MEKVAKELAELKTKKAEILQAHVSSWQRKPCTYSVFGLPDVRSNMFFFQIDNKCLNGPLFEMVYNGPLIYKGSHWCFFHFGIYFELHLVVAEYFCGIISFTHLYPHSFSQILIHTFTYLHPRSLCPITFCHPVMIRFAISFLKIKFNRLDRFKFNHFNHYM